MNLDCATRQNWDAIVVGAGPAGSIAARQLALAGVSVLLIDKAPLARWKVCGCCLNLAAMRTLASISLEHVLRHYAAVPLKVIQIAAGKCQATLRIEGMSLSRVAFDSALVQAAISSGVIFLPDTHAKLGENLPHHRELVLTRDADSRLVKAKLVLAADGLGGTFLTKDSRHHSIVQPHSRIGAGAIYDVAPNFLEPGNIYMACSASGYVGLVRLEDNRLNVAAALDLDYVRRAGGPNAVAAQILSEVGWKVSDDFANTHWRGTPALTRQAEQLAFERVLVLGDAAGYVEPFTGEGMEWALASAVAVTPLAIQAIKCWSARVGKAWEQLYRHTIARRQSICRYMAWGLRHPALAQLAIKVLSRHPQLAQPVIRRLNLQ